MSASVKSTKSVPLQPKAKTKGKVVAFGHRVAGSDWPLMSWFSDREDAEEHMANFSVSVELVEITIKPVDARK